MSRRAEQVGRELHRHMARSLAEVMQRGVRLTISRVRATDDLRTLRVWIQGWNRLDGLTQRSVTFRLREVIRSSSQTKFTPHLIVENDDSIDYAERIDQLLLGDQSIK